MSPKGLPVAFIAAAFAAPALAQEGPVRAGTETFKFSLGTILSESDSTVRLDGPNTRGVEFGLESVSGLQRDRTSLLTAGSWRFSPNHRIGFQSFSTRRHAQKTTNQDLVIKDQTIPAGTNLDTSVDTDFLIANYQYSLLRDDRIELAAMAGLYGARFKFGFNSTTPPRDVSSSTTAPLPMFGISLDTFITPRWTVSTFFEGLRLKVGDVKGSIGYLGMSSDYMLTRHFGVGLGISAVKMSVEATKSDFSGSFDWRSQTIFGYAQARF
jgi:hypothetical protein